MNEKMDSLYEKVEKNLQFLTGSNLRNKILLSLNTGVKNLNDLKNETGSNASTILHSIRDMENKNIIMEKEDGYHLTTIGNILSQKLLDVVETLSVFSSNQDFWISHNISGIPQKFLERINEIKEYEIITSSIKNVWRTYSIYFELISKAKEFRGVSPIFHPEFPKMIEKLNKKNINTLLVITDEILDSILEFLNTKKKDELRKEIEKDNVGIYITEKTPPVAFTVTDSLLSLSLFSNNGVFDTTQNLISKNTETITWGRDLFQYYFGKAKKVTIEYFR
jgi:predicted transcriptional regulator